MLESYHINIRQYRFFIWIHVVPMIVFSFRKKYVIFQNLLAKKIDLQIYYDRLESGINLLNYKTWITVSIHASSLCPSQSNLRYIEAYESTVNWVCLVNSLAPKLYPYNLFFLMNIYHIILRDTLVFISFPSQTEPPVHSSSFSLPQSHLQYQGYIQVNSDKCPLQ